MSAGGIIQYSAFHYNDVIMGKMASQITSLTIVYSAVYLSADLRKHQSCAPLAFVWGNSPGTGEFPTQRASNAEDIFIWWRHHVWISRKELKCQGCFITPEELLRYVFIVLPVFCGWSQPVLCVRNTTTNFTAALSPSTHLPYVYT